MSSHTESKHSLPAARDPLLFTPGPLTTSLTVKKAMLHDAGSWHAEFNAIVLSVRNRLLALAGVSQGLGWEAILLQGSGTFGVEAVFLTAVPPNGKVAVLANGAYGERMALMLQHAKIDHVVVRNPEDQPNDPATLDRALTQDPAITHVAAVHCETTTGILNPIDQLGAVSRKQGRVFVVDAMSSFAAYPIDLEACGIDFLISSANKCIEGVPGFSFVLCRRGRILSCEGWARSLSMDLLGQLKGFEKNGQFRYTPPTHSVLAFRQALDELDLEGGIPGRAERYRKNHAALVDGMKRLGFAPFLSPTVQSHIITSFRYPKSPRYQWTDFYQRVANRGFLLYPGKISQADTFRVGNIGRLFEADLRAVVWAIGDALTEMGIELPITQ